MSINWSTFLLEAVNFAILVWILQRFLYRPVLKIVRQRKQAVDEERAHALDSRKEAEALVAAGRRNLEDWEREREARLVQLAEEIERERARRLAALETDLEQERQKTQAVEVRRLADLTRENERRAVQQGAGFVARLLSDLAGPELEQRIAGLFLADLERLSPGQLQSIRATVPQGELLQVRVVSAYPLQDAQRVRITGTLLAALGREVPVRFEELPELVAGLQVHLGYWVLGANLRDELQYFAEPFRHGQ